MMSQNKLNYVLFMADTNLILAQRNAEWCGHGPVLEQDIAITKSIDIPSRILNISVYDHLIVAGTEYFSFRENKLL